MTCTDCGFEWFGEASAHALRTVGRCTRCRGELHFHELESALPEILEPTADLPAHLVLGTPRY